MLYIQRRQVCSVSQSVSESSMRYTLLMLTYMIVYIIIIFNIRPVIINNFLVGTRCYTHIQLCLCLHNREAFAAVAVITARQYY